MQDKKCMKSVLPAARVFARVSPKQKVNIPCISVHHGKEIGHF